LALCARYCKDDERDQSAARIILIAPRSSTHLLVSSQKLVQVSERSRVTVGESHVVEIVMIGSAPERNPPLHGPREIVPRMSVYSLEQSQDDPEVYGDDVQVWSDEAVEKGSTDGTGSQDQDLEGVSVLGGQTKGSGKLVVHLVNVLVEGTVVQSSVGKVVEHVLKDEEEGDLRQHGGQCGEGDGVSGESKVFCQWVETPDLQGATM
jgi:hypothetical protein